MWQKKQQQQQQIQYPILSAQTTPRDSRHTGHRKRDIVSKFGAAGGEGGSERKRKNERELCSDIGATRLRLFRPSIGVHISRWRRGSQLSPSLSWVSPVSLSLSHSHSVSLLERPFTTTEPLRQCNCVFQCSIHRHRHDHRGSGGGRVVVLLMLQRSQFCGSRASTHPKTRRSKAPGLGWLGWHRVKALGVQPTSWGRTPIHHPLLSPSLLVPLSHRGYSAPV